MIFYTHVEHSPTTVAHIAVHLHSVAYHSSDRISALGYMGPSDVNSFTHCLASSYKLLETLAVTHCDKSNVTYAATAPQ